MKKSPDRPPRGDTSITVALTSDDLKRLDEWIAAQPEPRPARDGALRHLADLGMDHGREVEMTRRCLAKADRDIREKFDKLTEVLKLAASHAADKGEGQKRH